MNPSAPPATSAPAEPPERALRRLFLTLFLRGRSARGLKQKSAPSSVGSKLAWTLLFHALIGTFALAFIGKPIFSLAVYLHAMTFVFLGMFVTSSSGEILFNKEEADILLHRPISPTLLLWAKVRVLIEVSLWLAGAFNLVGFFAGVSASDGDWRFPFVHAFSVGLEAIFCTGSVILGYQLCLRWLGRERLEGFITTAQVIISVGAVLSGQILPRLVVQLNGLTVPGTTSWWIMLLPPAWFAGIDDALAGSRPLSSWLLAAVAVAATALVSWLAFSKLAQDYDTGLQKIGESVSAQKPSRASRRLMDKLVNLPPLNWWLRDPVTRASFLLIAAYLVRDRDVKLRVYPALVPLLVMPFVFLFQDHTRPGAAINGFGVCLATGFLGIIPMQGVMILHYSQQWLASDIFRAAPLPGPGKICDGARRAVLCILTFPLLGLFVAIVFLIHGNPEELLLILPGTIFLPVLALLPNLRGEGVPLSCSTEESKSSARGATMIGATMFSMALTGLSLWAWSGGWFWWLVLIELIVALILYFALKRSVDNAPWPSME